MITRKRPPKGPKTWRVRNKAPRNRRLDEPGPDELLDDWMVACPAADPVPSE